MTEKAWNPFLKTPATEELEPCACLDCGNSIFDRYFKMYKINALKSASGKTELYTVPVYVCASCSKILNPDEEKKTEKTEESTIIK